MSGGLHSLLGLCLKARRIESGEAAVNKALNAGNVKLVFVAEDASERTREHFAFKVRERGIPLAFYGSKLFWGQVLQKPPRSVVAVTDKHFARGMLRALERGEGHIMGG